MRERNALLLNVVLAEEKEEGNEAKIRVTNVDALAASCGSLDSKPVHPSPPLVLESF